MTSPRSSQLLRDRALCYPQSNGGHSLAKRKKGGASLFDDGGAGVIDGGRGIWWRRAGGRGAARGGADALPQLRAVGHHVARAAGRARRAQAGAAPHPLHDVAAEPDRRRQAPQVRQGRRRRDGQLPPARRHGALRDAGPHGAVLLASLPARRRFRATSARSTATAPRPCATPSAGSRASATSC